MQFVYVQLQNEWQREGIDIVHCTDRKHMQDSDTKFWHHVLLGDWQDTTFWGQVDYIRTDSVDRD